MPQMQSLRRGRWRPGPAVRIVTVGCVVCAICFVLPALGVLLPAGSWRLPGAAAYGPAYAAAPETVGHGSPSGSATVAASRVAFAGTQTISYQADGKAFANPERGWYDEPAVGSWSRTVADGDTLAMLYVRLDRYNRRALPADFLKQLAVELAGVRGSGVKLILRFAYNRSASGDAPLRVVLQQIRQLAPILHRYADVIAVVQAGFIGQWGEWHGSTNGLLSPGNRGRIVAALLQAVPPTRDLAIRAPYLISDLYPTGVTAETAFTGTDVARLGQHNDCLLSGKRYAGAPTPIDRSYVERVSEFTAMGGETCAAGGPERYGDCSVALRRLAAFHVDYLNADYDRKVLDRWRAQGCYAEISRRLGYRFVLRSFDGPTELSPGDRLGMSLLMANEGFGKLYNPRPMELVLVPQGGGERIVLTVAEDARRYLPGPGATVHLPIDAVLPENAPEGRYRLYLALPDASPELAGDPAYSVRLADQGMWRPASGLNDLAATLSVE